MADSTIDARMPDTTRTRFGIVMDWTLLSLGVLSLSFAITATLLSQNANVSAAETPAAVADAAVG